MPRVALVALAVLATSVGLGGCQTVDNGPLATLQAMPDAHLPLYSGAVLVSERAVPTSEGFLSAKVDAYVVRRFGLTAAAEPTVTQEAIIAYYASLLGPLGWGHPCSACAQWTKPGYYFELSFLSTPSQYSNLQGYTVAYDEYVSTRPAAP